METMIRTQKQLSLVCTYLWFADQHPLALGIKSSHLSLNSEFMRSLVCTYLWFADQHPLALGIKSSHLSPQQRVYEVHATILS
nr:hypothetical protein Iba_chr14bCG16840 [Ipomoea batatas]